jgi:hypothetical protein
LFAPFALRGQIRCFAYGTHQTPRLFPSGFDILFGNDGVTAVLPNRSCGR